MLRSVLSGWGATVLSVVSTYLTLPIVLHSLGNAQYGVFLVLTSFVGYATLLSLGVPMAAVREYAGALQRNDIPGLSRIASTITSLFVGIALLVALCVILTAHVVGERWSTSAVVNGPQVAETFLLLGAGTVVSFVALSPVGLLNAAGVFLERNLIVCCGLIAKLGLTLFALPRWPDMRLLAGITLSVSIIELLATIALTRTRIPQLHLSFRNTDWSSLKPVVQFGVFVLLLNAASQLSFQTDSIVIGYTLGEERVPPYSVANSIVVNVIQLALGIAAVVMPAAARAVAGKDKHSLSLLLEEWSIVLLVIAAGLFVFSLSTGAIFLSWWVGEEVAASAYLPLVVLSASCLVFLPARGAALPLLMGSGVARRPTLAFLIAGGFNLLLSILLAPHLGLVGVAIGTSIPNVLVGGYMLRIAAQEAGMPVGSLTLRAARTLIPLSVAAYFATMALSNIGWPSPAITVIVNATTIALVLLLPALFFMRASLPSVFRLVSRRRGTQ